MKITGAGAPAVASCFWDSSPDTPVNWTSSSRQSNWEFRVRKEGFRGQVGDRLHAGRAQQARKGAANALSSSLTTAT